VALTAVDEFTTLCLGHKATARVKNIRTFVYEAILQYIIVPLLNFLLGGRTSGTLIVPTVVLPHPVRRTEYVVKLARQGNLTWHARDHPAIHHAAVLEAVHRVSRRAYGPTV
jgi:hypothetical protein